MDSIKVGDGGLGYFSHVVARHLAVILDNFQFGVVEKCHGFGSYRIELTVTFFTRIVDPENFEVCSSSMNFNLLDIFVVRFECLDTSRDRMPLLPFGMVGYGVSHRITFLL